MRVSPEWRSAALAVVTAGFASIVIMGSPFPRRDRPSIALPENYKNDRRQ